MSEGREKGRSDKQTDFEYYIYIYTGLEKMITTPSRVKIIIVRERPVPYSDSTSKNTLKKFISIIKM